jgi:hydrogenase maturation protease
VSLPNTNDPTQSQGRAPILVLGLGNLLLTDDGVGLTLLEQLQRSRDWGESVEFVDGGTRGIVLLGYLEDRRALLVLDAIALADEPGTVRVIEGYENFLHLASTPGSAHEGNALQLLQSAYIIGMAPLKVAVVGVAPAELETNIGLSETVQQAVPEALRKAKSILAALVAELESTVS